MAEWNESLSNELKKLNQVKSPNAKQKARIAELKGIKAGKSAASTQATSTYNPTKEEKQTEAKLDYTKTKDEQSAMAKAEDFYGTGSLERLTPAAQLAKITGAAEIPLVSTTMEGGTQNIADAEKAYTDSQVRDIYQTQALDRMMAGLEGISAPENQALREQGSREIKSGAASAARALRASGASGSSASNALARIYGDANNARAQQESALIASNVAEKGNRLAAFSNAALQSGSQFDARKSSALATLLGARSDVANFRLNADTTNAGIAQNNVTNTYNTGTFNAGVDKYNIEQERATALKNLEQQEKEKAGKLGVYYGEQAQDVARRAQIEGDRYTQQYMDIAKKGVGSSSSDKKRKEQQQGR